MSAIFKNRYITRLVIDSRRGSTRPADAKYIHVALGVFTPIPIIGEDRQPLMPEFFGIPMKYEMGPVDLFRIVSDNKHELHLTSDSLDQLNEDVIRILARDGLITRLEKGVVQLLEKGKGR